MKRLALLLWVAASLTPFAAEAHDRAAAGASAPVALDPGLGNLHHAVTTSNPKAQAYFDQGLRLIFAFNHAAAIQSFEQAFALDPNLAMAQWGIALAYGPNINLPMSKDAHKAAYAALEKAVALKPKASVAESAYIDALAKRYSANPEADVAQLSIAYANAMAELVKRYPSDTDAAVLYAESLMDLHPWQLWSPDGAPTEGTLTIVEVLEKAQRQNPDHMGALHYYIHAVEASPHPEKALPAARNLENLAPSAGHLVHMPAHVYIRTGNYLESARVNRRAAAADERTQQTGNSFYGLGYYSHNLHFLAVSEAMAGNYANAMAAADRLVAHTAPHVKEIPELDGFVLTQEMLLVKFGRWNEILALPEPAFEAPMTEALWHFARAIAFAGTGKLADAKDERTKFAAAIATLPKTLSYGNNNAGAVMGVALPYLDGRLALIEGNNAGAIAQFWLAVNAEDALAYDEPPAWYLSSREMLGTALLRAGDFPAAEQVFRDDLVRNPESGRALFGLHAALTAQRNEKAATEVWHRYEKAWRAADTKLEVARK
jgi:tetratricopeptide (TPR) repeat protein